MAVTTVLTNRAYPRSTPWRPRQERTIELVCIFDHARYEATYAELLSRESKTESVRMATLDWWAERLPSWGRIRTF